jgi:ubiquinone biosynthesis protein
MRTIGLDLEELARRGALVYMDMIFRDGFFHADPHPGNFVIMQGGVIGLLDCGMVGRLDESLREALSDMLVALGRNDADHLTSVITRTAITPPELDETALTHELADFLAYYTGQSMESFELGNALNELTELIRRYDIVLPTGLAMLIKVLVMLEGTSRIFSPSFNLADLIHNYLERSTWSHASVARRLQGAFRTYREWKHLGEALPRHLSNILSQVQRGQFDVHLDHRGLEPTVNRVVMGLITSSLFMGSALLWSHDVPPHFFGVSIPGIIGTLGSAVFGIRLIWAIWRSGKLERE